MVEETDFEKSGKEFYSQSTDAVMFIGKHNEDILYDLFGCVSCITTIESLHTSIDRLLQKYLYLFLERLSVQLHYDLKFSRLKGKNKELISHFCINAHDKKLC